MATTRQQMRQRIMGAGYLNDGIASTTTANGTTTSLVDTKIQNPDSFWNGGQVVINSGTANGDIRYITSWTQSTSTFVPDRAFSGIPGSAVSYEAHQLFSVTEKNAAINEAIARAGIRWPRIIRDTSLTMLSTTFQYALGSLAVPVRRLIGIDDIYYDAGGTGTNPPLQKLDKRWWEIYDANGTLTLQLHKCPVNSKTMTLLYRVPPDALASDAATLDPYDDTFDDYVAMKATAILYEQRSIKEPNSQMGYQAQSFHQRADTLMYEFSLNDSGHAIQERQEFNDRVVQMAGKRK